MGLKEPIKERVVKGSVPGVGPSVSASSSLNLGDLFRVRVSPASLTKSMGRQKKLSCFLWSARPKEPVFRQAAIP